MKPGGYIDSWPLLNELSTIHYSHRSQTRISSSDSKYAPSPEQHRQAVASILALGVLGRQTCGYAHIVTAVPLVEMAEQLQPTISSSLCVHDFRDRWRCRKHLLADAEKLIYSIVRGQFRNSAVDAMVGRTA